MSVTDSISIPSLAEASIDELVWLGAVATYGLGDVLTTALFLSMEMNHESHPVVASAIGDLGLWILLPWKLAVLAAFVALYRFSPEDVRIGVPVGLLLLGSLIVAWNTYSSITGARLVL